MRGGETLPPRLSVPDVCELYRCEERAARLLMHEAGAFKAAGKLWIYVADLDRWESEKVQKQPPPPPRDSGRARRSGAATPGILPKFWFDSPEPSEGSP